ncbi:MAG: hypothetical protein ACLR13_09655 [Acutalibacteraceae bacterium]
MPDEISAEEKSCWFQELWKKQEELSLNQSCHDLGDSRVLVQGYNESSHALG